MAELLRKLPAVLDPPPVPIYLCPSVASPATQTSDQSAGVVCVGGHSAVYADCRAEPQLRAQRRGGARRQPPSAAANDPSSAPWRGAHHHLHRRKRAAGRGSTAAGAAAWVRVRVRVRQVWQVPHAGVGSKASPTFMTQVSAHRGEELRSSHHRHLRRYKQQCYAQLYVHTGVYLRFTFSSLSESAISLIHIIHP